ncbi:MAG: TonB-dependent receptor [Verrucomicrobia bacterium]|nr:TonB-dependent receptor [Verrucomicrobiota bacterium]
MKQNPHGAAVMAMTAAAILMLSTSSQGQTAAPAPNPVAEQTNAQSSGANATNPQTSGGELEQVTVTGYLIPRVGEGPQPVATLNQDFIQKQAYQNVNDVLNNYPGGLSGQNAQTFAGNSNSPATSAFNLKSLPIGSTLILIDGFRFPTTGIAINAGTIPFVDINSIPLAAIDRIEILKDGGSATYGDDAIAGVVNIITKEDYNGADIINYFGESQRGDDEIYHLSMTAGVSQKGAFGKVSIVATFDYYDSSLIDSKDRAWSNDSFFSRLSPGKYPNVAITLDPPNGSYQYIGPSTPSIPTGTNFIVKPGTTGPNITQNDFVVNGTPGNVFIPEGNFLTQLLGRERRYGGTVNLDYDPTDWLKFYDHFIIQRNEETTTTPNQGFTNTDPAPGPVIIPANNPFNPFHVPLSSLTGTSLAEFGPWYTDTIIRTFRNVVGTTIQLPWNSWYIDAAAVYGESDSSQNVANSVKLRELQEALNGTLPQLPGVFFDPFTDQSLGHPNAIFYPYLRTNQYEDNHTNLIQYRLLTGGTLWALPSGDLTVAGGLEYRSESLVQSNDVNSRNFNITSDNFPGKLLSAGRWVQSMYGELSIPILGDRWSWPGLRSLQIILDERLDNYSHFGTAAKPKIAVLYKPCDDITFRATYSEGYIVPSLGQLFAPQTLFLTSVFDPVKGVEASNVVQVQGGNPNLKSENSYGYYLEAVWSPGSKDENSWWHWAKGFTAYFDWYQVELRNLISIPSASTVLAANLPGSVVRGADGTLEEIFANYTNLGTLLVDGIEFGASYVTKEYSWGKLELDANASYIYNYSLKQLEVEPNGFAQFLVTNLTDTAGGSSATPPGSGPDFKIVASIFYSKHVFGNDLFRTGFTLNYENSELDNINDGHGTIPAGDAGLTAPGYVHLVGSWTTVDWQISYEFGPPAVVTPETPKPGYDKEGKRIVGEKAIAPAPEGHGWTWRRLLDNTTFTFGIKNLSDAHPPLAFVGNGAYQGYDTLAANPVQRFFYGQIEKKF